MSDTLNQVSLPDENLDLLTQIAVLQSSAMLQQAVSGFIDPRELSPRDPIVLVEAEKGTSVLRLTVESKRADLAEHIAQQLPVVYRDYLVKSQEAEVDNAIAFLTDQYAQKKHDLKQAQDKLDAFQIHRPLVALAAEEQQRSSEVINAQQQAVASEAALAAADERLKSLQHARAALPSKLASPGKQSNSPAIQAQKELIAELKAKRDTLAVTYAEGSLKLREADAEIHRQETFLRSMPVTQDSSGEELHPEILQLDQQIAEASAGLKSAQASRNRLAAFAASSESSLREFQRLEPLLRVLSTDVDDKTAALDVTDKGLQQMRLRRNSVKDPVTILVPSSVPEVVWPRWPLTIALSGGLGILLGVTFCFVKDALGDKLTTVDQIGEMAGLRALAEIPMLPRRGSQLELADGKSSVLESYRLLRFNLLFSVSEGMRALAVTSSSRGEGKTELACNLAVSLADTNRKVILVDANMRNPAVHRRMGIAGKPGLSDILLGDCSLGECLHETSVPGLRLLTAGSAIDSPGDLLSSSQAKQLRDELFLMADLVIFDAPSVIGQADSAVLSSLAGAVLYVVQLGSTTKKDLRKGIDILEHSRANILGLVVSKKDASTPATLL